MINILRILSIFVLLLLLNACDSTTVTNVNHYTLIKEYDLKNISFKNRDSNESVYKISFDFRNAPQEDIKQYYDLIKYLEKKTNLKFNFYISKESSIIDALGMGNTDIVITGAMGFLKAKKLYHANIIARGLNKESRSKYRSFFVTKINSSINSLEDLQNSSLSFGNKESTQGYLIPQIVLKKKNIHIDSFKEVGYAKSHQECAERVISGKYDVAAMQDTLAQEYSDKGLLKIIYKSNWYPSSGIIASNTMPKEVFAKIKLALLTLNPQETSLYHWEKTEMPKGFTDIKPDDYKELEHWAKKLGLL